jgi:small subunit ribosomal protein S23e
MFLFFSFFVVFSIVHMGKPKGIGAARKLRSTRSVHQWQSKTYKKTQNGAIWKTPFQGSSQASGVVVEKIGIEAKQPNSAIRKAVRVQLIKNGMF